MPSGDAAGPSESRPSGNRKPRVTETQRTGDRHKRYPLTVRLDEGDDERLAAHAERLDKPKRQLAARGVHEFLDRLDKEAGAGADGESN